MFRKFMYKTCSFRKTAVNGLARLVFHTKNGKAFRAFEICNREILERTYIGTNTLETSDDTVLSTTR